MTTFSDPVLREVFLEWPAWQDIAERVLPEPVDAATVDPREVHEAIDALPNESVTRLAYLMVANSYADSVGEGAKLLGRLHGMAAMGRRPRFGVEAGITSSAFDREES